MPKRQLNISLDYDGTASEDPTAFMALAELMRQFGHNVYIVTMRYESEVVELRQVWANKVNAIYPTSRMAKRPFMEAQGINIDIWIDDTIHAIEMHAGQIWSSVTPEGGVVDNAAVLVRPSPVLVSQGVKDE